MSNGNGSAPVLGLTFPPELIEAIAERTAELLAARAPEEPEPYLNVEDAAKYLAAPVSRVYDLRRQGLPAYKDGARLLFKRTDLDAHLRRDDPDTRSNSA